MPLKAPNGSRGPILLRDMPTRLVLDFKTACYTRGTTITDCVCNFLENYVKQNYGKRPLDPEPFISFATYQERLKGNGLFVRNIPRELRNQFKAVTASMGTSMQQVLYRFILDYTTRRGKGKLDWKNYGASERKARRLTGPGRPPSRLGLKAKRRKAARQ